MIYIMDVYNCNVFVDTERMIHQWMISGVPLANAMFTIP